MLLFRILSAWAVLVTITADDQIKTIQGPFPYIGKKLGPIFVNAHSVAFAKSLGLEQALIGSRVAKCALELLVDSCTASLPSPSIVDMGVSESRKKAQEICRAANMDLPIIDSAATIAAIQSVMRSKSISRIYAGYTAYSTDRDTLRWDLYPRSESVDGYSFPWCEETGMDPVDSWVEITKTPHMPLCRRCDRRKDGECIPEGHNTEPKLPVLCMPTEKFQFHHDCIQKSSFAMTRLESETERMKAILASTRMAAIPITQTVQPSSLSSFMAEIDDSACTNLTDWTMPLEKKQKRAVITGIIAGIAGLIGVTGGTAAATYYLTDNAYAKQFDSFQSRLDGHNSMLMQISRELQKANENFISLNATILNLDTNTRKLAESTKMIDRKVRILTLHTQVVSVIDQLSAAASTMDYLLAAVSSGSVPPSVLLPSDYEAMDKVLTSLGVSGSVQPDHITPRIAHFNEVPCVVLLVTTNLQEATFDLYNVRPFPIFKARTRYEPMLSSRFIAINRKKQRFVRLIDRPRCLEAKFCAIASPELTYKSADCEAAAILELKPKCFMVERPGPLFHLEIIGDSLVFSTSASLTVRFSCTEMSNETAIANQGTLKLPHDCTVVVLDVDNNEIGRFETQKTYPTTFLETILIVPKLTKAAENMDLDLTDVRLDIVSVNNIDSIIPHVYQAVTGWSGSSVAFVCLGIVVVIVLFILGQRRARFPALRNDVHPGELRAPQHV